MPDTRTSIAAGLTLLGTIAASASEPVRPARDGARKMGPTLVDGGDTVVFATHERRNLRESLFPIDQ